MYKKRGQVWYLNKRVPKRYESVEPRNVITVSLRTSCRVTAVTKGEELWNDLLQSWEAALEGDTATSQQQYERAMHQARRMGFDYIPAHRIAHRPIEEVLARVEAAADKANEEAVLGLVAPALSCVSQCLDVYLECYPEAIHGKSDDQLRRFCNPRRKVIDDFLSAVEDRAIDQLTRTDMLAYRSFLVKKVQGGVITAATANKNMTYFCSMIRGINRRKGLGLQLPFDDLGLKQGRAKRRGAFSKSWIETKILAPGALDPMDAEARNILLIMVNTGARPSEIAGIKCKHLDVNLDIPMMRIAPDGRVLKNDNSERDIPLAGVSLEAAKGAMALAARAGRTQDDWVFPKYAGKDRLTSDVNAVLRKQGLKEANNTTFYSLRHSFEDRLIVARVDDRVRRDLFGHALNSERYGTGGGDEMRYKAVLSVAL